METILSTTIVGARLAPCPRKGILRILSTTRPPPHILISSVEISDFLEQWFFQSSLTLGDPGHLPFVLRILASKWTNDAARMPINRRISHRATLNNILCYFVSSSSLRRNLLWSGDSSFPKRRSLLCSQNSPSSLPSINIPLRPLLASLFIMPQTRSKAYIPLEAHTHKQTN